MSVKQISVLGMAWLLSGISLLGVTDTPLADAAEIRDGENIRALLQQSFGKPHYALDVNVSQVDGMTALHWAAHHDDLEIAQLLVRSGANVNAVNRYGVTPLTLACTNGNGALVNLLLDAGADPNTTLPGGETALMTAARTGRLGPIKALLSRGADVHGLVHGMGRQEGPGDIAIESLRDPSIRDYDIKAEQTALMWATAEGHVEVVEELIKAGAEYRASLASGFTPLLFAVREGHMKVVQTLVKSGVDVNQTIETHEAWQRKGYDGSLRPNTSPLHVAVENGHFELAAYLVEAGANPDAADPTGYTVLHAIVGSRITSDGNADPPPEGSGNMTSLEFVNKLAAHGANLDARMQMTTYMASTPKAVSNGLGTTPFLTATQTADVELMKTLTKLGANPLLRNENNKTALMLAGRTTGTEEEVVQAMQMALNFGVEIDAIDENGETAMHAAAYKDRPEVIMFLADKGAKIEVWNRENKFGMTPLAIAAGHRRNSRGALRFRPQPKSEAAIREVMIAAGLTPPTTFTFPDTPVVY